jgi:peptide/nickel transport system permease protein
MLALGAALALALAIGLPAGLLAGTRRASPLAAIIRLASSLGSMMPAFLLALAIMVFFVLYVLPLTGVRFILLSSQEPTTDPRRLLPIALTLAVRPLAYFTAVTEAATRDTLAADYIRTARAKGLPELLVLARHVLPHVLVTLVGAVPAALLFSVSTLPIVEFVFSWPGVGQELLYRIVASPEASPRTAALVAFLLASIGGTYVLVALLAETARRLLDPRAHLAER